MQTMPYQLLAAGVLALVALLAGCGEPKGDAPDPEAIPTADCTLTQTEELYVKELYRCPATYLYVFATPEAKGNWRKAAEEFGAVVVNEGPVWIKVKR